MDKKSIKLNQNILFTNVDTKLLVNGQGVLIFKNENYLSPCTIYFYNKDNTDGLKLEFSKNYVNVSRISNNKNLLSKSLKNAESLINCEYYWFSIDSQNQRLYAGIGEARIETIIYEYNMTYDDKKFLESIIKICISEENKHVKFLKILRDPITMKIPLLVKNTDELTMNDIAYGNYLPKSNLSIISQKLYDCISGKKFILDDDDFPDFSKAIEYSIITPTMWCHKKLKDKSKEFNPDKKNILETYLRITLGQNNGESPGIPYVMEIWPIGHYSPIHSHAGANAIIRVLHGNINVKLFPFLCSNKDNIEYFNCVNFYKDDITWISPTLNQTHQLMNDKNNTETCITIQCYMYDNENSMHYDYFDYLDEEKNIKQYEPDSDMDFISFKNKMKEEWNNR